MTKPGSMRLRPLLIGLLAAALLAPALPALADGRAFPPGTKRGVLTPGLFPQIGIDGKTRRMAPGGRIYGPENLLVMPVALSGKQVANYLEDAEGSIALVWILTATEAAQPAPKPATTAQ